MALDPLLEVVSVVESVVVLVELVVSALVVLFCAAIDLLVAVLVTEVPVKLLSRLLSESSKLSELEYWLSSVLRLARAVEVSLVVAVVVAAVVVSVVVLLLDRTPGVCPFWAASTRAAMRALCRAMAACTQLPGVPPLALNVVATVLVWFGSVVVSLAARACIGNVSRSAGAKASTSLAIRAPFRAASGNLIVLVRDPEFMGILVRRWPDSYCGST